MTSQTTLTGGIGEHLVCADLRKQGYVAFLSPQDCFYDVVLDTGSRLHRVQVKTASGPVIRQRKRNPSWEYTLTRASHTMKTKYCYGHGDYDIAALVALDIYQIAYLPPTWQKTTISIRSDKYNYGGPGGVYFQDLTLEKALSEIGHPES